MRVRGASRMGRPNDGGAHRLAHRDPLARAPAATSQEVDASPLDTRSPAKTAQRMTDLALLLLVQGPP